MGEIGRSSHANDGPPRRRKGYDAPDRRLVRPETGWPGHETELSSLRYRAVHWIHIRGSPDGKSKERTLGELWRFGEHRSIEKKAESTGRSATIFATILGRFGVLAGDYEWFVRDTSRGLRC